MRILPEILSISFNLLAGKDGLSGSLYLSSRYKYPGSAITRADYGAWANLNMGWIPGCPQAQAQKVCLAHYLLYARLLPGKFHHVRIVKNLHIFPVHPGFKPRKLLGYLGGGHLNRTKRETPLQKLPKNHDNRK
jgi:hypothetical protein